jgi:hypothetical protein
MGQPRIAGIVHPHPGSKGEFVFYAFGALINKRACIAAERFLVLIAFDQVLADFRRDPFEQKPHVAQNGIIAQDRVAGCVTSCTPKAVSAANSAKGINIQINQIDATNEATARIAIEAKIAYRPLVNTNVIVSLYFWSVMCALSRSVFCSNLSHPRPKGRTKGAIAAKAASSRSQGLVPERSPPYL